MDKKLMLNAVKDYLITKSRWIGNEDGQFHLDNAEVTQVHQSGGEGQGENYYVVFKISNGTDTMYVKCDGYYNSWDSSDWSDGEFYEVEPHEVTVTQYRAVK